jgi:ATP-binding cassette subfamily A (ABC1) protein 3
MDPVARRFMWSVISRIATENKQCSIILTTHSMEEVEALATRIGIMVGGRLRCLGNAQHLKNRHGSGFMSEIKLLEPSPEAIAALRTQAALFLGGADVALLSRGRVPMLSAALGNGARGDQISEAGAGWALHAAFVRSGTDTVALQDFAAWWVGEQAARNTLDYVAAAFPGSQLVERQGTTLRFRLPSTGEPLAAYFAKLEQARTHYGVASYTLGQTTLEQLFVQFAGMQDEETGVARGMANVTSPKPTTAAAAGGGATAPPAEGAAFKPAAGASPNV